MYYFSVDYDAPLSEAGDITEKFEALKEVFIKYNPVADKEGDKTWWYDDVLLNDDIYGMDWTNGQTLSSQIGHKMLSCALTLLFPVSVSFNVHHKRTTYGEDIDNTNI